MTALDFIAAGVEIDARANVVFGPEGQDELIGAFRVELARRIDVMTRQFPLLRDVPVPVMRMPGVEPARFGACDCCGDTMKPYRGGMCELCQLALMRALTIAGRV